MGKFSYRPIGIGVSIFLVVSRLLSVRCPARQRGLNAFLLQTVMLYNFQLYFRTGPQPLDAPPGVNEGSNVTGPGAPVGDTHERAANAVMLMLARNRELKGAVSSVKQLEENFNWRYHYPWVFLNDEPFSEEFKR